MFFSRPAGVKYIDRGLFTEHDFSTGDFIKDNDWHEKDLSSIIGKGVKLVHIYTMFRVIETNKQIILRAAGDIDTKNIATVLMEVADTIAEDSVWVLTDKDGKIDYYCSSGTWTYMYLSVRAWLIP